MDAVQRLTDRVEIIEMVNRYASGMDLLDRPLYESCFTDPLEIDFASWDGTARTMSIKDWGDYVWEQIVGLDATQHIITNHHVTFQGDDDATCVAYLHATHYIADLAVPVFIAGGFYTDRMKRTADGWKIAGCTCTLTWRNGDIGVMELAKQRPPRPEPGPYAGPW
jgi:SnoaL-like protein